MADAIRRARQKREKTADAPSSTQTIGIEMQANPIAAHDTAEAMGEESTAGPLLPAGSEGSESQNDEDTLHTSGKKPGLMQITAKWSNDTNLFVSTDYFTGDKRALEGVRIQQVGAKDASFYKFKKSHHGMRWSYVYEKYLDEEPEQGTFQHHRWRLAHVLNLWPLQFFFMSLVVINGIMIGIAADYPDAVPNWDLVELCFLVVFVIEIGLKYVAFGRQNRDDPFFGSLFWKDGWNCFDLFVILLAVIDTTVSFAFYSGGNSATSVLRVARVLRLVRLIGRFERLNTLIQAFAYSLYSVMWVGVLMILFLYIFGVMATNMFGNDEEMLQSLRDQGVVAPETWWSSVPRSMSSLLQVITGDSWNSELGRKMGEYNPWALLFIMAVLVFVGLGFLNLMSAVFVESLLEMSKNGAAHDRKKKKIIEEKAMENVAMLFAHIDTDGNGMLDENEVQWALENLSSEAWEPILKALGVTVESLELAMSHLDYEPMSDGTKVVYYEDFLSLFVGLEAPSTKKNVYQVEKSLSKLSRNLEIAHEDIRDVKDRTQRLEEKMDQILALLTK